MPRWVLSALLIASFFDEGPGFLPAGTLEAFRTDFRLNYAQAGLVLSMVAIGSVTGSVGSIAADHVSRRILASSGALGLATAMAVFAVTPRYEGLLLASLLHGFTATVMMDATSIALADLVGKERLRPFLARANLAGVVGDLSGPILLGVVVASGLTWRASFIVAAILVGAYGAMLAAAPLPPPPNSDVEERSTPMVGLRAVSRDPQVWLVAWISLLAVPFDEPFLGFLLARADAIGASAGGATAIALVSVAGGVLAYGWLETRLRAWSDRRLITAGAGLGGAGSLVAGALPNALALALGGALVGIGLALAWLALEHRQLTLRQGQEGTTRALIGAVESIGFALPVLMGVLIDATSLSVGLAAHVVLAALIVVAAHFILGE